MRAAAVSSPEISGSVSTRPVQRSNWWREVLIIATFYVVYTRVRDVRGDRPVSVFQATTNAHRLIRVERWFGLFHEANIQHWFLHYRELIRLSDDYYGTIHFVAVIAVLALLFFRYPYRYRLWRNTLAIATGLALIGFSFFPVLPPRLLPAGYHFVDTLRVVGGLWSFSSGPVSDVSNQYAAMPSLHTTWSAWCAIALIPLIRPLWGKILVALYPVATIFCIIVTANHYFADVIAGLVLLGVSYLVARAISTWSDHRYARRYLTEAPAGELARSGGP
jgi:hypothetical protein